MPAFTLSGLSIPNSIVQGIVSAATDDSAVAKLAGSTPATMLPNQYHIWSTDPEAEFVAEGAQKSPSDFAITPVVAQLHKAQVTVRMTKEVQWADEDARIGLVDGLQDKLGGAVGRALDYGVFHGASPLTGTAVTGMTGLVSMVGVNTETATGSTLTDFDGLADGIITAGYVPDGIALAPSYANDLRKYRNGDGIRMFPEITTNTRELGRLDGLNAAVSGTVNGRLLQTASDVLAIEGEWRMVKWGIVRDLGIEVIEFGDPDGLGDLKRNNEVAIRAEIMFSWAVLDPAAFAVLESQ